MKDEYEELKSMIGTWNDEDPESVRNNRPRIDTARKVADAILNVSSATNGKLSQNHTKI